VQVDEEESNRKFYKIFGYGNIRIAKLRVELILSSSHCKQARLTHLSQNAV
jgi:hypothetical protein